MKPVIKYAAELVEFFQNNPESSIMVDSKIRKEILISKGQGRIYLQQDSSKPVFQTVHIQFEDMRGGVWKAELEQSDYWNVFEDLEN